jgi:hypothetical protein
LLRQIIIICTPFGWNFNILSNSFPSSIDIHVIISVLQNCEHICSFTLISLLFFAFYFIWFLGIKSLQTNFYLFVYILSVCP